MDNQELANQAETLVRELEELSNKVNRMCKQATQLSLSLKQKTENILLKPEPVPEVLKNQEYLTYQEFADQLQIARNTVKAWVCSGKVNVTRFSKRVCRIHVSEIKRLWGLPLEKQENESPNLVIRNKPI